MSDIARLFANVSDASAFFEGYVKLLSARLQQIDFGDIARLVKALERTRADNGWVYLAGNGGSAATAMHWANDLRALGNQPRFRTQALSANPSVLTCIGNDQHFDQIFAAQIDGRIQARDLLILLSASGQSPNIIAAAQTAKAQGATVAVVVGFDGGTAPSLADLSICVHTEKGEYGIVEDAHLAIAHMVSNFLRLSA